MQIHYICRGNTFRSIMAEAYTKSLQIQDLEVLSSGTVAGSNKPSNRHNFPLILGVLSEHGVGGYAKKHNGDQLSQERLRGTDVAVIVNQIAYDEVTKLGVTLPEKTYVWDITDIGERDRIPSNDSERLAMYHQTYDEICQNVDELISSLGLSNH